jgi:hypothetical protein
MKQNERVVPFSKGRNCIYLLTAILMFILLQQCKCKKYVVEIKQKVIAIHGIAFLDVNNAVPKNVRNVKVTLIDPEKMVLSSNGIAFETVELASGVMSIGLSAKAQINRERPYRFTIRAEADGYMTNIRSIVITDSSSDYVPIYMAKLDSLPASGLASSLGKLTVSGGVFTQDQVLSAALPNPNVSPLTIKISKGTQVLYDDRPVETKDSLSFRLLFGIPRDTNANRVFPGGFVVTDAIDANGKRLSSAANPIFFTTAGWFSMEMNVGKTRVNGFSKPLDVEIPIADTVINPTTQKPIQAGDTIPFWSLDNRTGAWRIESNAQIVASTNGGLKADVRISHLSTFNLDDWSGNTCDIDLTFSATDFPGPNYLTEYINTLTQSVVMAKKVDFTTPPTLHILRIPKTSEGIVYVHDGVDVTSKLLGISVVPPPGTTLKCLPTQTSGASLKLTSTPGLCILVRFEVFDGTTTTTLCQNNAWLQNPNTAQYWTHVGNLNNGEVTIPRIPQTGSLGTQSIQLWYAKSGGGSIDLKFDMNFDNSGIATVTYGGFTWMGTAVTFSVSDTGPCSSALSPGTSKIVVTIPSTLITGAGIMCPP